MPITSSSSSTQMSMPSSSTLSHPPAEKDICQICINTDGADIDLKELECSHLFHAKCIVGWIPRDPTCPTCRAPILNPIHLTNESLFDEVKSSNDKKWLSNVIKSWDETYVKDWDTAYKNIPAFFRPSRPDFCIEANKRLMTLRLRTFTAAVASTRNTAKHALTNCFK